ncbi:unnamed protein product, partial [Urochloa humidicola]
IRRSNRASSSLPPPSTSRPSLHGLYARRQPLPPLPLRTAATQGPRHPLEPSLARYVPEASGHDLVDLNLGESQLLKGWPELAGDMPASVRGPSRPWRPRHLPSPTKP